MLPIDSEGEMNGHDRKDKKNWTEQKNLKGGTNALAA